VDKNTILKINEKDPNEFLNFNPKELLDAKHRRVLKSMFGIVGIFIVIGTIVDILSWIGLPMSPGTIMGDFIFKILLFFILGSFTYGAYLGFSNKAVFYCSKRDLGNNLLIVVVPIAIFVLIMILIGEPAQGSVLEKIMSFVMLIVFLCSGIFFGSKSNYANVNLNEPLSDFQLMCVAFAKFFLPYLFIFLFMGTINSIGESSNKMKKATNLTDFHKAKDSRNQGLIGLGILSALTVWLWPKAFNIEKVMENR
jgi:hypothetical protein